MSAALATGWQDPARTPRRQRLVKHLYACGERLVLEALLQVMRRKIQSKHLVA
jgi:hypothetical protein